jgi:hypothetical protein
MHDDSCGAAYVCPECKKRSRYRADEWPDPCACGHDPMADQIWVLDIYFPTDEPETCPQCGRRTEFLRDTENHQIHECPECEYRYVVDLTEELI